MTLDDIWTEDMVAIYDTGEVYDTLDLQVRPEFWEDANTVLEDVTAIAVRVEDGSYTDIWVTDSTRPYLDIAEFEHIPSRFIW